jgi:ribosomal protein S13
VGAFGIITVICALVYAGIYKIVPSLLMIGIGMFVCTLAGVAIVIKPEDKEQLIMAEKRLEAALSKLTGVEVEFSEAVKSAVSWKDSSEQKEKEMVHQSKSHKEELDKVAKLHKEEIEKARQEIQALKTAAAKKQGPPAANDNPETTNPKIQKPPEVINRTRNAPPV